MCALTDTNKELIKPFKNVLLEDRRKGERVVALA